MSLQSLALSTALFQSTPPVKAATASLLQSLGGDTISIHAAREGGDIRKLRDRRRAGRFQSTPPVKAATSSSDTMHTRTAISIHAAREGGDVLAIYKLGLAVISIHAAREGGDLLQKDIF